MPPASRIARDLPVLTFTTWDTVSMVRNALDMLEQGQFMAAAQLAESMTRDDRVAGVLSTRVQGLLGMELEIESGGESEEDPVVERLEEEWPGMFPESSLSQLLRWGIMVGLGLGQKVPVREKDKLTFKLKVWHPQFVYWRWDSRSYWVATMDGSIEVVPGDDQWVVYTPYGYERGWMGGHIRSLAIPWLARQWALRDWARYSEVHGLPVRAGIVPQEGKEEDKERFLYELAQLSNESVIRLPQGSGPDGAKFDVKLVEALANTWEGFRGLIDQCNAAIAIDLLGQNLTTEVKGGSFAASQTHERIRQDVLEWDEATLSACLDVQAIKPWVAANFGDAPAPTCHRNTDPPEDLGARATAAKTMADALVQLKAVRAPVDVEEVAEAYGIPLLEGAEMPDFTEKPDPPVMAPPLPGQQSAPGKPPMPPVPGKLPPEQAGRAELGRLPKGLLDGQLYADALADHALATGAEVQGASLEALLAEVKLASSYSDLRTRLARMLKHASPERLAEVMEKALILADLAGRHAALEAL